MNRDLRKIANSPYQSNTQVQKELVELILQFDKEYKELSRKYPQFHFGDDVCLDTDIIGTIYHTIHYGKRPELSGLQTRREQQERNIP